jgi:hypothetical protein
MRKIFISAVFLGLLISGLFAQSIDKSQYKEIDLFSYQVEGNQKGKDYTVKYKMVLKFSLQSGTIVYFQDDAGDSLPLRDNKTLVAYLGISL